jgi:hypothetical protein
MGASTEKQRVLLLRQQGMSYNEIQVITGIPRSTIRSWLQSESNNKTIGARNSQDATTRNRLRLQTFNKALSQASLQNRQFTREQSITEYRNYHSQPLFTAGLGLFIGNHGMQQTKRIALRSKDPNTHKLFVKFLMQYLGVPRERIRFLLQLYRAHDQGLCEQWWYDSIKVPKEQWYKAQRVGATIPTALHYGIGNTIISDTKRLDKLLVWAECLQNDYL